MTTITPAFRCFTNLLAAVALTLVLSATASAEIVNSYDFNGDLSDTLGNGDDLTDAGGSISGGRYSFSDNQGLRLTSALQDTAEYAIELRFQVNDDTASWNKLIDYEELALDFGLYVFEGGIDFWTIGPELGTIDINTDVTVGIERSAGSIEVFLNGTSLFTAADPNNEAVSASNILNFFEDDVVTGQGEAFTGSVDFIRIHDDSSTFGTEPSTIFSIVVIPDTQMYAEQHPEVFEAQMDWIVANRADENIIYVAHLGDIKDDGLCDTKTVNVGTGGGRSEWQIVDQAIAKLDAENIPYGLAVGNHDFDQPGSNRCPNWSTERPLGTYNSLFGPDRYIGDPHYGDPNASPPRPGNRVVDSNEDNFTLFEASGVKFIAINLAYKEAANRSGGDPELDWADDLLKTYDDRIGIVTSHFFVWENPERSNTDPNDEENVLSSYGQEVYDRLSINQNLFLMMSAHRWGEAWRVENTGRDVSWPPTQILLADYQRYFFPFGDGDPSTPFTDPNPALLDFGNLDGSGSFGDSGLMRIMRFDPDTGMVNVETFIPPVMPIKGRPSTIVSTYFPASGDEMDKDTASNFSFTYLGYTP